MNMPARHDPALKRAIIQAGGAQRLAKALGVTVQAISQWKVAPVLRVLGIEQASGVSRYDLRPDIYGQPPAQPSPAPRALEQGGRT